MRPRPQKFDFPKKQLFKAIQEFHFFLSRSSNFSKLTLSHDFRFLSVFQWPFELFAWCLDTNISWYRIHAKIRRCIFSPQVRSLSLSSRSGLFWNLRGYMQSVSSPSLAELVRKKPGTHCRPQSHDRNSESKFLMGVRKSNLISYIVTICFMFCWTVQMTF